MKSECGEAAAKDGKRKGGHGVIMLLHKGGHPIGGLAITFGKKKGGADKKSALKKG